MGVDHHLPGTVTDRIAYPCIHGPGTTHLDSFAHMFFRWEDVERVFEESGYKARWCRKGFDPDDEEWHRDAGVLYDMISPSSKECHISIRGHGSSRRIWRPGKR